MDLRSGAVRISDGAARGLGARALVRTQALRRKRRVGVALAVLWARSTLG